MAIAMPIRRISSTNSESYDKHADHVSTVWLCRWEILVNKAKANKPATPDGVSIRPMRAADADQVLAIYQAGLDGGNDPPPSI
jgi:hypothetical protein